MKILGKYSFGVGDRFSHEGKAQLEALRTSLGKSAEGTKGQLAKWVFRKFITYSNQTGLYTKTDEYLKGDGKV